MELRVIQHLGARPTQQDAFFASQGQTNDEAFTVGGVADGVGGSEGGAYAAYITAHLYARFLLAFASGHEFTLERFRGYCERARRLATRHLCESAQGNPKLSTAATTISAFAAVAGQVFITNIGDSPVLAGNKHGLRVLSCEHSRAAQLVSQGVLSRQEYEDSPYRGILVNYISAEGHTSKDAHYACEQLGLRDRVIACSDGAMEAAGNACIHHACGLSWIDSARHKLDLALRTFAVDNATLVLAGEDDLNALDQLTFNDWEA
ncbi:MAG: hypothetical protein BroJett014_03870 [Planctomycetota bacterium]|nr:hypothetical protein [Planctomycetota bacterium]GIK51414.1 MAG: hypothetical protein BroJett014_03870 [Planctomycetota bacterium]